MKLIGMQVELEDGTRADIEIRNGAVVAEGVLSELSVDQQRALCSIFFSLAMSLRGMHA